MTAGSTLVCLLLLATPAASPSATATASASATPPTSVRRSPDETPRVALQRWLDLSRKGQHAEAAELLEVPEGAAPRAEELSRRLKAVLDRHLWFDMDTVSNDPEGASEPEVPADMDVLGTVPGPTGAESVTLVRRDGRWRFSTATVERVDAWFDALPSAWTVRFIPEPLLRPGPKEVLWWQWMALPLLALLAVAAGKIVGRVVVRVLGSAARRTDGKWDDTLLERARGPVALAAGAVIGWSLVPFLDLYLPAQEFVHGILSTVLYVSLFWMGMRAVDIAGQRAAETEWARGRALSTSLVPVGARAGKVLVASIGLIAILSTLGYPVASLLAGLGIGGLAVALAAQKTVENVFGAFSIGVDQPFREGDFVKIEDFVGTVEKIGLRSTRIRTLDRTIISLPNGKLADMRLETFAARDRIRLYCTVGLVYDTTAAQMKEVLAGFEAALRAHPKIWPDAVVVRFVSFGASSLDVEVMAWFQTADWNEFTTIRQGMFLDFMHVVERAGSSFAFPTRTVHVVSGASSELAARG